MNYFEINEGKLVCRQNGETLIIEAWGDNSLRVRARLVHEIDEQLNFALLDSHSLNKPDITIDGEQATYTHGKITVIVDCSEWGNVPRLTFINQKGERLLKEVGREGALNKKGREFKGKLGGDHKLTVTFESNRREKIYGMGQYQQEVMDLKGCLLELAHRNSQASIPFYLSNLGYGFFWHNPAIGKANFGLNTTEWLAESTKQMDYWITAGDSPAEIEERYAEVTGKVPMMPEYGLGFWQCKLRYYNQEQVLAVAREYKRRKLPIDVMVVDFFHWPKMGDFRFNEEFFPNPKAMVAELQSLGIELMVSIWPQISFESENYEEMKQQGLLIHSDKGLNVSMQFGGDSVFYDATNPRAREYVWQKCRENYHDLGIKLFWLDEAEPEFAVLDFDNYRYYAGPVEQVGNLYPQQYSKTFYDGQVASGQENNVNLVRCAWAGSQKYGALVWSGDIGSSFADLRKQICAGLHMGIAGIPWWTTDIGGFHGGNPKDPQFQELLVRWFQYGAFCPVMRLHGDRQPMEDIFASNGTKEMHTGADNEVWSFGNNHYDILVNFMEVRELLRDYTRQLMAEANQSGTPVIRSLFYEFPEDQISWEVTDQYMYGSDLLVAPIVEANSSQREVYLPQGAQWTHASTGDTYQGGHSYPILAPLKSLPVFLREGAQSYLLGKV